MNLSMMEPMSRMSSICLTTIHTPTKASTPVKMLIVPDSFIIL